MELARVMSQYEFDKTLVFVAFAGEDGEALLLVRMKLHNTRAGIPNFLNAVALSHSRWLQAAKTHAPTFVIRS